MGKLKDRIRYKNQPSDKESKFCNAFSGASVGSLTLRRNKYVFDKIRGVNTTGRVTGRSVLNAQQQEDNLIAEDELAFEGKQSC